MDEPKKELSDEELDAMCELHFEQVQKDLYFKHNVMTVIVVLRPESGRIGVMSGFPPDLDAQILRAALDASQAPPVGPEGMH